jgi:hypothetical protein
MKSVGVYLFGYFLLLGGVLLALWKSGVLHMMGTTWTLIGLVIALGLGIMIAVGSSRSVEIDRN